MKSYIKRIALSLCLPGMFAASAFAQTITGKITGTANQPVVDVVVTCSGCKTVRTDAEGVYTIEGVKNGSTINFVREGYYPQSQFLKNADSRTLNIHLIATDKSRYNQTYVLGTGTVENNPDVVGAENLNRKDFTYGSMTLDKALKGTVTGLNVTNKSGMTGEGAYLQMRGTRSFVAENQPLIVVNGVPFMPSNNDSPIVAGYSPSAFQAFNSKDIRNVTVLKGSEASMFGSLGANGVIMIETDQATSTDVNTRITLSALYGHNWSGNHIPMMNATQYKSYLSDMGISYYKNQEDFFNDFTFLTDPNANKAYLYGYNTDWQDLVYRNSNSVDFLFRVEGGDNIAKYNISLGYMGDNGTIKDTYSNRYNAQVNSSVLVCRELEIQACINAAYLVGKYQNQSLAKETSPLIAAYRRNPLVAPYASDMYGNLISSFSGYAFGGITTSHSSYVDVTDFYSSNPLSIVTNAIAKGRQYDMNSKFQATYRPIQDLSITGAVSMYYNYNQEESFMPGRDNQDIMPRLDKYGYIYNEMGVGTYHTFNMYYNLKAAYQLVLNRINTFNVQAGFQALTTNVEYDAAFGRNNANDFYKTIYEKTPAIGKYFLGFNNKWNWMDVFAHVDYRYADLFKLGFTGSWDGASSVGKDTNRMSFYPAGDVVFYGKNYGFLRTNDFFDKLNVYASYGITGNSRFSSKLGKYYYTSTPFMGIAGIVRANVPNTLLKPERDYTLNAGFETALWNNRLNLGFNYYNIDARDVLMAGVRSSVLGSGTYYNNDARIKNRGVEVSLSVMPISTPDFRWMIGGNITTQRDRVESLGSLNEIVNTLDDGAQIITSVGGNPYAFYGYKAVGVFSTTAEAEAAGLKNHDGIPFQAGDVRYVDVDGDGYINDNDKFDLGSAAPKYFGSLFTRFEYRNWALDLTFAYSKGNKAYNAVRRITESGSDFSNQSTAVTRRWTMEGQITDVPRVTYGDNVGNNDFSSRWIEDASYIKLRDITLSYNWNKNLFNFLQGGTVYLSAENLLCASKYLGLDPEFSYSNSAMLQGVDFGKVGAPRSVKFGVNLKF